MQELFTVNRDNDGRSPNAWRAPVNIPELNSIGVNVTEVISVYDFKAIIPISSCNEERQPARKRRLDHRSERPQKTCRSSQSLGHRLSSGVSTTTSKRCKSNRHKVNGKGSHMRTSSQLRRRGPQLCGIGSVKQQSWTLCLQANSWTECSDHFLGI